VIPFRSLVPQQTLARRLPCAKSRGGSGDRGSSIRNLIEVGNGDRCTRGASRAANGRSAWPTRLRLNEVLQSGNPSPVCSRTMYSAHQWDQFLSTCLIGPSS
jgi:hypothetical protein